MVKHTGEEEVLLRLLIVGCLYAGIDGESTGAIYFSETTEIPFHDGGGMLFI